MATMPSDYTPINADNSRKIRAKTPPVVTLNLFPHGAQDDDDDLDDEKLRRYYDTRLCSPIAAGALLKSYNVNGNCINYYDFFGLGAPEEETISTDPPTSKRRATNARREAAAGQQNAGQLTVECAGPLVENWFTVAVVEEEALVKKSDLTTAGEEDIEEGEFVPDDGNNVEINYAAEGQAGAEGDMWKLRKVLTKSDVNTSSRLLLFGDQVRSHVFKYVNESEVTVDGKHVRVWDADMQVEHTLRLAKWMSSGSYVLKDGWKAKIVDGRKLKKGDEVGFYWDPVCMRFIFSVLKVAAELEVAAEPEQAAA